MRETYHVRSSVRFIGMDPPQFVGMGRPRIEPTESYLTEQNSRTTIGL